MRGRVASEELSLRKLVTIRFQNGNMNTSLAGNRSGCHLPSRRTKTAIQNLRCSSIPPSLLASGSAASLAPCTISMVWSRDTMSSPTRPISLRMSTSSCRGCCIWLDRTVKYWIRDVCAASHQLTNGFYGATGCTLFAQNLINTSCNCGFLSGFARK